VADGAFRRFGIFVAVLLVLKYFVGWEISIVGSVILTILVSLAVGAFGRR